MRSRPFRPELTLFATLFLAGAAGAAWLLAQLRFVWDAERSWPRAEATILEAGCDELQVFKPLGRVATRQLPRVFYAYEVAGREYEGRAIAPLWLRFVGSDRYQERVIAGLAPLATTAIRYDPRHPERSFLTLDFDRWLVAGWLALALGCALASGRALVRARVPAAAAVAPERPSPRGAALFAAGGLLLLAGRFQWLGESVPSAWGAALLVLLFAFWPLASRLSRRRAPRAVAQT